MKLTEAFKSIMEKYQDDISKLQTEEWMQDMDKISEKYNGVTISDGFIEETAALRIKHAPNLVNMDKEMLEARKVLGMPDYL